MNIYENNESGHLKSCLLCYPVNYRITNKSSTFYNKVDYTLACNQYNNYVNLLIEEGVKIRFIDIASSSKQVYAKDIGFVIDSVLFISKMSLQERQLETEPLKTLAAKEKLEYYIMQNNIEGGDVAVAKDVVFVGVSQRTNLKAIHELDMVLREKKIKKTVIPINFDNNMLHLDCVFALLGEDSALVSPYVYDRKVIESSIENIIEVTMEEADGFGTNIVYLGNNKLITSSISVGSKLKDLGYDVKIIDFTEIVKGDGSVDCATLTLYRE